MTEEEYIRMKNLLDAVVEQQATFARTKPRPTLGWEDTSKHWRLY